MNLLLLLSALLSAITGVSVGPQRVQVAAEQVAARTVGVAAHVAAEPQATLRFVHAFDAKAALRLAAPLVRLPLGSVALYASRRRE